MSKQRYVDSLSDEEALLEVMRALVNIMMDYQWSDKKKKTSFKKYMTHHLGTKWKVDDIEKFENLTLKEIIEKYEK
jgi:hypothetical protein